MKRISSRIGVVVATVGLALTVGPSAYAGPHPLTVQTPSLAPDPGGYLYCRVVAATNTRALGRRRPPNDTIGALWRPVRKVFVTAEHWLFASTPAGSWNPTVISTRSLRGPIIGRAGRSCRTAGCHCGAP